MGLDTVEIVMRCEETFGISISDADAARIGTPRQLAEYVADRVDALPDSRCLSRDTYRALRDGFSSQLPALTSNFNLNTPLKQIVHRDQWERVWSAIRGATESADWPATVTWNGLFSAGPRTFRDLVWVVACSQARAAGSRPWTRQTVYLRVREIIQDESGLDAGFNARKSFPQLGIE